MAERVAVPWVLPLAVGGFLAAAAFGVAGRAQVELSLDPLTSVSGAEIVALLVADAAWVLAATLVVMRTSPTGAVWPALRRVLLVNAVLLAVTVQILAGSSDRLPRTSPPGVVRAITDGDPWRTQLNVPGLRYAAVGVTVFAVAAAVVGVVLLVWTLVVNRDRFFRHRAVHERVRPFGRGRTRSAAPEEVLDAIVRARSALASGDRSRQAVIAAYAAMERAIETHRAARRPAQTATEFVTDALETGVLSDQRAAHRLLRLFELARFSHEDLPHDAATTVEHDLGLLQSELEGRVTHR